MKNQIFINQSNYNNLKHEILYSYNWSQILNTSMNMSKPKIIQKNVYKN